MHRFSALFVLPVLLLGPGLLRAEDFGDFLAWLPGVYRTDQQAAEDEAAQRGYRHVRARLRIVRLPASSLIGGGSPAFYLEQALAGQEDKPYRQRIVVFEAGVLKDFRITDAQDLVGASAETVGKVDPARLVRELGCEVSWQRVDGGLYKGSAGAGRSCKSSLRGATHVISYSELTPNTLTSLDQGFEDAGGHKWGPPPGVIGHIFRKENGK